MYTCPFPFSVSLCISSCVLILGACCGHLWLLCVMLWGWWMRETAEKESQPLLAHQGGYMTSSGKSNKMWNTQYFTVPHKIWSDSDWFWLVQIRSDQILTSSEQFWANSDQNCLESIYLNFIYTKNTKKRKYENQLKREKKKEWEGGRASGSLW